MSTWRRTRPPAFLVFSSVALLLVACTTSPSPSPSAPETSEGPPSASPAAEKIPADTIQGLLARLYLALDFGDSEALAALSAPGAMHAVYLTDGTSGEEVAYFALETFDIANDPLVAVAPISPMIVGQAVAVPVRYQYLDGYYYGFDLLSIVSVDGGYLVGDGVTLYGTEGDFFSGILPAPDDADLAPIAAEVAGWNADSVDDVLATFTDDAAFWDGVAGADRVVYTGDDLGQFVTDSLWFSVEITDDWQQMGYGAFIASPNRLTSDTDAGDTGEGISVYEIRDGEIALHVWLSE